MTTLKCVLAYEDSADYLLIHHNRPGKVLIPVFLPKGLRCGFAVEVVFNEVETAVNADELFDRYNNIDIIEAITDCLVPTSAEAGRILAVTETDAWFLFTWPVDAD